MPSLDRQRCHSKGCERDGVVQIPIRTTDHRNVLGHGRGVEMIITLWFCFECQLRRKITPYQRLQIEVQWSIEVV